MSPVPLPLPLVQIALGSIIASVANLGVALKPDIFFLLFLPPLLFLDGWRIPKDGLFRDKGNDLGTFPILTQMRPGCMEGGGEPRCGAQGWEHLTPSAQLI